MINSQELITTLKEVKQKKRIPYNAILDELKVNGVPCVSKTTLRRIFENGSELKASSFNYEETLLPVYNAVSRIAGLGVSPEIREIESLKAALHLQTEELAKILELKEQLAGNISFMKTQIAEKDALIRRLIDRLDQKDEIIRQLLLDLKTPKCNEW